MRLFIVTAKFRGVPYGAQHWADVSLIQGLRSKLLRPRD
jgi:hypothetical protein